MIIDDTHMLSMYMYSIWYTYNKYLKYLLIFFYDYILFYINE